MSDENTDIGPMTLFLGGLEFGGTWVVTNVTSWNWQNQQLEALRWSRDGRRESVNLWCSRVVCEDRRFE